MLGLEGWRRWPLRVSILDEEVVKIWVQIGKKEGIYDIDWSIVGEEIGEFDVESEGTEQETKRDLNLKKLMTLDINDGIAPSFEP
jgi:hypothetical protein